MKLNFIGDVYINREMKVKKGTDLRNLVLNLEAPLTGNGEPASGKVNLYMEEDKFFKTFKDFNISAVNLSNNHIMDYGEEAFSYTLKVLKKRNIPFFGAGKESENFNNPVILSDNTALFGYSCHSTNGVFGNAERNGAAPFSTDKVIRDIEPYKNKFNIIVSIHWGQEYFSFPKPEDVQKARNLIEKGVDLIIGHHTHKIQSKEIYKGKKIYYSLGNGIFNDGKVPSKYDGDKFTAEYIMRYKKSCRYSFKVMYDTETGSVTDEFLYYNRLYIKKIRSLYLRFKTRIILSKSTYKIYSKYQKLILAVDYRIKKFKYGR